MLAKLPGRDYRRGAARPPQRRLRLQLQPLPSADHVPAAAMEFDNLPDGEPRLGTIAFTAVGLRRSGLVFWWRSDFGIFMRHNSGHQNRFCR